MTTMRGKRRDVRFVIERIKLVRYVSRADSRGHIKRAKLVAIQFLKDRGYVETCGRRNYAASDVLLEDAMIEFHALDALVA